jgi:tRNA splicing endonuclease
LFTPAGMTITSGSKFGGQLMAYPGDPKLYHAQVC